MIVLLLIGAIYYVVARPDRRSPKLQDLDSAAPVDVPLKATKG
jgi:hypothetical protein